MNRTLRTLAIYAVAILALALLAQRWFDQMGQPREVTLTRFLDEVTRDEIEAVEILSRTNQVQGRLAGSELPAGRFDVVADYTDGWEGELTDLLREQGVFFQVNNQPDGLWAILISLLPWVFLLGFMIFIFMQMQGSGNRVMQFGKARARMVTKEQPKVTFHDVAGLNEAIEELQEIKDFLQNPDKY
ncbi:MAG TPA: ATP-dependent metallopeptidase FtsH/Yme1/Tma family protein, partial [Acidimicrobiia bacterium]|nr:ATP-dependent metallopeptidase FtsH/Yme1/Tma family protein [Acidimicrobiia bacterium]